MTPSSALRGSVWCSNECRHRFLTFGSVFPTVTGVGKIHLRICPQIGVGETEMTGAFAIYPPEDKCTSETREAIGKFFVLSGSA
jgi:hypothetical protein